MFSININQYRTSSNWQEETDQAMDKDIAAVMTIPEQTSRDTVLDDIPTALFVPSTTRRAFNCKDKINSFFCLLTSLDVTMAVDATGGLSHQLE